jgi:integrase
MSINLDHYEHEIGRASREYLLSEAAASDAYRKRADTALREFQAWCQTNDYRRLDDLTTDGRQNPIREYAKYLRDRVRGRTDPLLAGAADQIQASTAETTYNVVRGMLEYAVADGRIDANPAARKAATSPLPTPDGGREEPHVWRPADVQAMLRVLNQRIEDAAGYSSWDARAEYQDRALVATLVFAGVRGAEVLSDPSSEHEGRQGLTWGRVHLEDNRIRIYRKTGEWEHAQLPRQAVTYLDRHRRVQDPPTSDWPVFPTRSAPTLAARAREELENADKLLAESTAEAVLRNNEVPPPSLTTEGARRKLQSLCDDYDIEPVDGAAYLKPHGARHALGTAAYRESAETAQKALGHTSPETTSSTYEHIETEETAGEVGEIIEETFDIE